MPAEWASVTNNLVSTAFTMGGAAIVRNASQEAAFFRLPSSPRLQTNVHITEDWAQLSGMLRRAAQGKGNFGLGIATREQAHVMGKAWVGDGYRISSDGTAWISSNNLRQYRPSSIKGKLGKVQANFERKFEGQTWNNWPSNGHLDVLD